MDGKVEGIEAVRRAKRRRNERTQLLQASFVAHAADEIEVGCECGDHACADVVRLALDAYAAARADPRYFVVCPGHEDGRDTVMARSPRSSFVRVGRAGRRARLSDGRRAPVAGLAAPPVALPRGRPQPDLLGSGRGRSLRQVAIAFGVAVAAAVAAPLVNAAAVGRSPICTRGLRTVERDPRGLLPLTDADPVGAAARAAVHYGKPSSRPQVRTAIFATADAQRGPQARFSCGTRVWQRTIVVYVLDRAMLPAQSASQRVYFVGRFRDGYHVWQVVH